MKNAMKKLGLVAATALSLSAAAFAHGDGFRGGKSMPPEMLQKFDANKDGQLSDSERLAMKQELIKKFDANSDGQLDETERLKAREARAAEKFKRLDTNNDGALSLTEFQAGMKQHGRHGPRGQR